MAELFESYTIDLLNKGLPVCPSCSCQFGMVSPTDGTAYAKLSCANGDCNKWIKWLPRPTNIGKKSRKDTKGLLDKYSRGFCEMCLRRDEDLPPGQVLHAHHVIEKQHGGDESKQNIWVVCTKCHRYIHHERTYLGHYVDQSKYPTQEAIA